MMDTIIDFLYSASILFSTVMAFIYRKYLGSRKLSILLPYLIYVFIQELILWLAYFQNSIVYNIYRPITILVFFWIYYNIPFMAPLRKLLLGVTITFLAFTLIDYCFFESIFDPSSYLTLGRGVVVTFYGILFLFRYFNLDNHAEEKYWRPLIWITSSAVIFYSVVSISLSFQKYLAPDKATVDGFNLYNVIPQVMSIFMYSCFGYAFYLCQKKN
ncbi:MAG: hypothetical protein Q8941_06425 [Bacteroidota bacterium]|nr:hypothetical protein [Bacteroidota bacterium]